MCTWQEPNEKDFDSSINLCFYLSVFKKGQNFIWCDVCPMSEDSWDQLNKAWGCGNFSHQNETVFKQRTKCLMKSDPFNNLHSHRLKRINCIAALKIFSSFVEFQWIFFCPQTLYKLYTFAVTVHFLFEYIWICRGNPDKSIYGHIDTLHFLFSFVETLFVYTRTYTH